ncbi:hypothetical protein ACT009_14420 [Sphingomonas sp. Tas61C01]|uniref:hypothetical protein n=1 Tax=Sphingomonas sp. Tas61C01 TaxID=3458297 RepID=UPI00403EAB9A
MRRRDEAFASDWGAAVEAGYQLLETHLVGIALATSGAVVVVDDGGGSGLDKGSGADADADAEQRADDGAVESGAIPVPTANDFEAGYRMLRHRATGRTRGWRGGSPPLGISTREDTDADILKKLAALAARRSST